MAEDDSNLPVLEKLLNENPNLIRKENRVKCILTGHEISCKVSAIEQYLKGKKYLRLTKDLDRAFNYADYEPMIIKSIKKGQEHLLFCTLTLRHINKTPTHLLRHVAGRKYLRAKKRWDECQKDGKKFIPTPYLNRMHEEGSTKDTADEPHGDDSDTDSLSDLYPVKYLEELSLDENQPPIEATKTTKASRKRTQPPTKKSKFSKPSSKKKKDNLVVYS